MSYYYYCPTIQFVPSVLQQLFLNISMYIQVNQLLQPGLEPPTKAEARLLQQLLVAGCGDQVARRIIEGNESYCLF